jgi:hypothetical protein
VTTSSRSAPNGQTIIGSCTKDRPSKRARSSTRSGVAGSIEMDIGAAQSRRAETSVSPARLRGRPCHASVTAVPEALTINICCPTDS